MAGIRVPDATYQAGTPEPEQAQVPMPKQPTANPTMFGTAQAEAGEQAGEKVQASTIDIAKDIIQQKAWSQTAQAFQNREVLNEAASKLMDDTNTHDVANPDGTTRQVINGYGLRTGADKVSPEFLKAQLQQLQSQLVPPGGWLNSVAKVNARYTDEVISSSYNKLDAYNKDQYKRDTAEGFQNAYSKSLLNSSDQPTMSAAIHYTQAPLFNMLANGQVAPKDHIPAQEKNALDTMNNFAQNNIGKMTAEQLKAQVDDAQKASGGMVTNDIKNQAYATIDKLDDAYQKQVKINSEHAQSDSVNEFASGVGSGKYNATNANAILSDKNLPSNVGQALYSAVMNVNGQKIASINKGGTMQDKLPLNEQSLNLKVSTADKEESKQTAKYTLAIANSLNTKDATDKLVTAITSDKLDKTQLEVYTRTLALVGQYSPTETEAGDGKTIDPKGAPQIAALKTVAEYAKDKPGASSLIKNYLDGIQSPNADPTAALTGAMRTHALQINPKLANIPEGGITATDKYGNRRMIFPDLHTEAIKKSSGGMNVPSSSSKSSTSAS